MVGVLPAVWAELLQFHPVRMLAFVASCSIITVLALFTSKNYDISHFSLSGYP